MSEDNNSLELKGLDELQRGMYWQNRSIQMALDKTDGTDRAAFRAAYNQALSDLAAIQSSSLSTEAAQIQAIKGMAGILEKLLRFMKEMIV